MNQSFFLNSITSILALFFLAAPGYILVKVRILKVSYIPALVAVLLYVNQPMITIHSFMSVQYNNRILLNMLYVIVISILVQLIVLVISLIVFKTLKFSKDKRTVLSYASMFGNVGFMGIPVIQFMIPNSGEALIYVATFLLTFNILCWTVGIYVLTGEKKYISFKKIILNPPFLGLLFILPFFIAKTKFPHVVIKTVGFLSDMNTPLALTILGMRFADIKIREVFKGYGPYIASFIKLLFFPLLTASILLMFKNIDNILRAVLIILSAMPSANMVLIMAERHNKDGITATKAVMISTILSLITVPVISLII